MTNIILGYFGSILVNYLADVLPVQRKLVRPYCHECQHEKSWKDYLLPAACEQCGARASGRHLIVLILGPVLAGMLYLFPIENLGNYGAIVWLVYFGLVVVRKRYQALQALPYGPFLVLSVVVTFYLSQIL